MDLVGILLQGKSIEMAKVAGIVLAAGLSKRMGRPKLLLKLNNESVIYKVVRSALFSRLDEVVLVTGKNNIEILESLQDLSRHTKLKITHNKAPELGMSSSIKVGMVCLGSDRDGAMIILGDQPKLSTFIINTLGDAFSRSPTCIVAPTVCGRQTTPVVFPARFFSALMSLKGDRGARPVIDSNPDAVIRIEVGEVYDDTDIDTLADWEKFKKEPGNKKA